VNSVQCYTLLDPFLWISGVLNDRLKSGKKSVQPGRPPDGANFCRLIVDRERLFWGGGDPIMGHLQPRHHHDHNSAQFIGPNTRKSAVSILAVPSASLSHQFIAFFLPWSMILVIILSAASTARDAVSTILVIRYSTFLLIFCDNCT